MGSENNNCKLNASFLITNNIYPGNRNHYVKVKIGKSTLQFLNVLDSQVFLNCKIN